MIVVGFYLQLHVKNMTFNLCEFVTLLMVIREWLKVFFYCLLFVTTQVINSIIWKNDMYHIQENFH